MPNGYDKLFSEIRYVYQFLDYCEALLGAQEKMFRHLGALHQKSALRPRLLTVLDETEVISRYVEEKVYPHIKHGILEHNETMGGVFSVNLPEAMKNAGYPEAAINDQVKKSLERTRIDLLPMEKRFGSIIDAISSLKEHIRNYDDES
jgi:hypothetical protein